MARCGVQDVEWAIRSCQSACRVRGMDPDWYAAWRDEAFEQLRAKNRRLQDDFRLGSWSRYNYDLKAGKLLFSEQGSSRSSRRSKLLGQRALKLAIGSGLGPIRIGLRNS
ncbi:DUF6882 domain-containing protein [Mesorhizobium sp. B3-1-7]|uniref:DUF6882 domain-containing protein n=1 Tax=Mesorhizobium sp. B3-1-7 TaxID=2589894 RepID=UPI0032B2F299